MSSSFEGIFGAVQPVTSLEYRSVQNEAAENAGSADSGPSTEEAGKAAAIYTEEQLVQKLTKVRMDAVSEAFARAKADFDAKLAAEQQKIVESLAKFKHERDEYYANVERELVHLALSIAGKILHREAQVDKMLLAALARIAVENLQQRSNVAVRVRPEACEQWREYFQSHLKSAKIEVLEDSHLGPNDCVLETDLGTADISIDSQLKEIERGFFDLLAQRPGN